MAKRTKEREKKPGYGRLLDAWVAPRDAGEPVGCVATTFTFSAAFFEEECLGRFLQLDSDPQDDGIGYAIEFEEKIAQCECTAVLVDQHHCRGSRNLRWDLLCARPRSRILHAKVAVMRWTGAIRILVASANLTDDGYRRNREVFCVMDLRPRARGPIGAARELLGFLRACENETMHAAANAPERRRWRGFLDGVESQLARWRVREPKGVSGSPRLKAIVSGLDGRGVLDRVKEAWPDGSAIGQAAVMSPFFDPPDGRNAPALALWGAMKQRGRATVAYHVEAEKNESNGSWKVHAPANLIEATPRDRSDATTIARRLRFDDEPRPLHAKGMLLRSATWACYLAGSSNFTSPGLGLGRSRNLEANVACFCRTSDRERTKALESAWPDTEDLPMGRLRWEPPGDSTDEGLVETVLLHPAFRSASYSSGRGGPRVIFQISPDAPVGWRIRSEDNDGGIILSSRDWSGRSREFRLKWTRPRPPTGFWVGWRGAKGEAWWPVNVDQPDSLPAPEQLETLHLDELLAILTSAQPLHRVVTRLRAQRREGTVEPEPLDPHRRVDTSQFLLRRTRRFSEALTAFRQKLERPAFSEFALRWRLRGPVGVEALRRAIGHEARSEQEKVFLLAELALDLTRVRPTSGPPGSLSPRRVRSAIRELAREICRTIGLLRTGMPMDLRRYVAAVRREVR